jgi:hypothetical protein
MVRVPVATRTIGTGTRDGAYRAVIQVTDLARQRYIDKSWRER